MKALRIDNTLVILDNITRVTFEENDDYLVSLRRSWDENIKQAFDQLPSLEEVFASGE